jgi:hypothetical protein
MRSSKLIIVLTAFFLILVGSRNPRGGGSGTALADPALPPETAEAGKIAPAADGRAAIFVKKNTDGTDDGVAKLLDALNDPPFYRRGNAAGIIGNEDVIIIKINSQWAERGGTNTDLLKGLSQSITDHPDGFKGEVIIADNGQSMFGSRRNGGSLDWDNANSKDRTQSAQDVADQFERRGFKVSGVLWDRLTRTKAGEFESGDNADGFVVEDGAHSTGLIVSYAKFTTKYGTSVSFKKGIWNAAAKRYDSDKLKVINAPVLKSHGQYQVTAAIKSYMGTPSNSLTNMAPHNSVGRGGMGAQMAMTRFPALNILDMIWIAVDGGPNSPYSRAVAKKNDRRQHRPGGPGLLGKQERAHARRPFRGKQSLHRDGPRRQGPRNLRLLARPFYAGTAKSRVSRNQGRKQNYCSGVVGPFLNSLLDYTKFIWYS